MTSTVSSEPAHVKERPTRFAGPRIADVVIATALAVTTFFVHNVGYLLSAPYWLDESWVAVSTRVPLSRASDVTATTPLGWTLLLRTAFFGGDQRQRMIPLVFSALTVVAAYAIARGLPWRSVVVRRVAGALAGVAVLMAPSSLARNDLKQYTADAFVTLLVILMVSRVERTWTRRSLVGLAVVGSAGFLFSAVALFAVVAAFTALLLVCLARRQWSRLLEVAVAAAGAGIASVIVFLVLYRPHVLSSLTDYWRAYYVPVGSGLRASIHYLHVRGVAMATYLGMGPTLLAAALVVAGFVTMVRLGRPALALSLPLLLAEMTVLSAAKKYPLFDERTSHFLTIGFALYAAVGVGGLCALLARQNVVAAVVAAAAAATVFVVHVHGDVGRRSIPVEDVRTPVAYILAHGRPDDVILVNSSANWGFGYYWSSDSPSIVKSTIVATGFTIVYPKQPRIDIAAGRTAADVKAAVSRARALVATRPGARIWLVRTHVIASEAALWRTALAGDPTLFGSPQRAVGCALVVFTPSTSAHSAAGSPAIC